MNASLVTKAREAFYATLKQDAARVDALFDKAAQTGIAIEKKCARAALTHYCLPLTCSALRSATKDELIAHVKGGGAIIVLVDTNYLVCNKCAPRWWKRSADRVLPPSSYHGHYIILIAYNESKEEFAFRDPDRADGASLGCIVTVLSLLRLCWECNSGALTLCTDTCFVFASQLDTARKRTGTDEDILWIHAARPSTVPPQPPS